ncbi:MAG: hypothetical protein KatS3mg001_519 [Candidatus Pacearchaeota archaeon]|nr:MAG: hypothetical protein KatS3mg001_519 [Candidatus Pacearchaeota archaeon]
MIKRDDKRGISPVVGAVLIVALTVFIAAMVWLVVNNLVQSKTKSSSCFETFDKVKINQEFTCYNFASNEARVSIEIKDIQLDAVLVSILSEGNSKSFKILNKSSTIQGVVSYPDRNQQVSLPAKNAGKTYIVNLTLFNLNNPDSISLAPIIGENQCDFSDSLEQIPPCVS